MTCEQTAARMNLLDRLVLLGSDAVGVDDPLTHVRVSPARAGSPVAWPAWAHPELVRSLARQGIDRPWAHQVQAAQHAWDGQSVVLATGTASGKSLAYHLPALSAVLDDDRTRVLYLAPTKALAGDQLRSIAALRLGTVRAATYDGDTPAEEREWVRAHANWVLTNPDMLHQGILPRHAQWSSFLRRLRFVVVDECHSYYGVFGAHVAHIVRRLRRVCASYGANPTFVLASATSADPQVSAGRLTGVPVTAVVTDTSPRAERTVAFWQPPLTQATGTPGAATPVRRPAAAEAARLLAELARAGARTLVFCRSRRAAELTSRTAQRLLADSGEPGLARRIAAYRAGYLSEERRALEQALDSGQLLGVAATNALELGIDITGLDAVVLAGYPGSLASLWQRAGRAGRRGKPALVVFVGRADPLDTYLLHHPDAVFDRPVEATVCDPDNPYVLGPQLCYAAAEMPLTEADLPLFGGPAALRTLQDLVGGVDGVDGVGGGVLRRRPAGWYWTSRERPHVDIRGSGGDPVVVVESSTGSMLGTVDASAAPRTVHSGAVYLHQQATFVVEQFRPDEQVALVRAQAPDWTTYAQEVVDISIVGTERSSGDSGTGVHWGTGPHWGTGVHWGTVDVTSQVVSYQRRRIVTGEVIDQIALDLPAQHLRTQALWCTVDATALGGAGRPVQAADLAGALHAAEHAAIGLLPLFARCDQADVGGLATAMHPDTGQATFFVYDGYPGGAGFTQRGFEQVTAWLGATREAIAACGCRSGCPACVQSPRCGSGNDPLHKHGAVAVLDVVLAGIAARAVA